MSESTVDGGEFHTRVRRLRCPGWPDDPHNVLEAYAEPEVFAHTTVRQVADHFAAVVGGLTRKPVSPAGADHAHHHPREVAITVDHAAAGNRLAWRWLGNLAAGVVIGAVAVTVLTRASRRVGCGSDGSRPA